FNLLFAKDFDPNTKEYITYVQDIDQDALPGLLMELSQMYFEQLGSKKEDSKKADREITKERKEVFQCRECLTVYDEIYGDITQEIAPGILFEDLPENYKCPVCEAPKTSFGKKVFSGFKQ